MSIRYLDIRRFSTEDGPGLRTVIVLKGCSLACRWCHRPESIGKRKQLIWQPIRCQGCESCVSACPSGAISFSEEGVSIDRSRCNTCFACLSACPAGALACRGRDAEAEALFSELAGDCAALGADVGVTLSGGEPLLQKDALTLLRLLHEQGIHTALATSGMVFAELLEEALSYTDVALFDLKTMDDGLHKKYTGHGNGIILRNLGAVAKWAKGSGRLWIRTPLVPGVTDTEDGIRAIGGRIAALNCAERWELRPISKELGKKHEMLGNAWPYKDFSGFSEARLTTLLQAARDTRACADIRITGYSDAPVR